MSRAGPAVRVPWREMALVAGSLAITWIAVELGILVAMPGLRDALLQDAVIPQGSVALIEGHFAGLYQPDPHLGWVPTPHHRGRKWGVVVETKEDGIRSNGSHSLLEPRVLAIGDSNTFGDEVADEDTWPAQLERLLGVGVVNAGVSSYGLDQMVLRAEDLVPRLRPRVLAVGLISDSLGRAAQAVRHGSPKPYFVTGSTGQLELRNAPVPPPQSVSRGRQWLGRSYLVSFVMDRLAPRFWWRGTMREFAPAGNDIELVGRRLIERLVLLARRHQIGLCVLFMDFTQEERADPDVMRLEAWLSLQRGPTVRSIHTVDAFSAAASGQLRGLDAFVNAPPLIHFNREGQRVVAEVARPEVAALLP